MPALRFVSVSWLLIAIGFGFAAAQPSGKVELTYIANEGFLITGGGKKVLVDALLREGIPQDYPRPAPETLQKMESAQAPFDRVDLVLATHFHRDHFNAASVAAHLKANPQATFVSVHQAADLVAKEFAPGAREFARILSTTPDFRQKRRLTVNDIPLEAIRLPHGNFENTGFLITLAGKKILHLGDSNGAVANFDVFDLQKEQIDVALIPYWYFLSAEGKRVVREHIGARQIIAIHLSIEKPDGELRREVESIRREFPSIIIAIEPGRHWSF